MDKVLIEKWYKERKSGGLAIWVNTPDDAAHKRNIIASVYTYEQDKHADLILEAVNACKAINPDNPIKVAESLPDIIKAAKQLTDTLERFYEPNTVGWMWAQNLKDILTKATEKTHP